MGIELPAELADVAAAAGVRWPRADEDAMRATAQAWRQAGTRTSTLAVDADHTAGRAMSVVQGTAGTAAARHWQTFVAPDTGHLSRATQGCLDAADRLDHAADQVGAAKVQIVRHLVTLAQHTDAANQAAAAGHPSAVAGLPVAVQGTAVNVAHVNHTLTNSITLPTSPAQAIGPHAQPVLSAGVAHGGGPLGHAVDSVVGPLGQPVSSPVVAHGGDPLAHAVDSVVGSVAQPVASPAVGHGGGPLAHTVDVAAGAVAQPLTSAGGTVLGAAGGLSDHVGPPGALDHIGAPGGLPDHPGPPVAAPIPAGPPSAGVPSVISPDPTLAANQPLGHPAPPLPGTPSAPGVTTAQSAAPPVTPPPVATAPPLVPPAQPTGIGPAQNTIWPAAAGPAPTIPGPTPTAGPAPTAGVPIAGPAPTAGPAPAGTATPTTGPAPTQAGNGPSAAIGAVTTTPPPRSGARSAIAPPPTVAPPPIRTTPPPRDELALFLMYLFPDGHRPADANRPISRQLPPPPPDTDFAAGLRFPPHDHPESHRIVAVPPGAPTPQSPPRPAPADLTAGYDPLGYENQNEHDWDRRFVVRAGVPAEYAWPLFQEGGCTDGEPVVLEPGTAIDRFGPPEGRVFSAAGTPYARRSLPPDHLGAGYRRYRVTRALPVWHTLSAPWFGQPGGAVRLRSVYPAADLVAFGYLAEETHGQ